MTYRVEVSSFVFCKNIVPLVKGGAEEDFNLLINIQSNF